MDEIVLGLPKNMNDTEGVRVELTKEFKEKLERRTGLPVYFWDERLTTVGSGQGNDGSGDPSREPQGLRGYDRSNPDPAGISGSQEQ